MRFEAKEGGKLLSPPAEEGQGIVEYALIITLVVLVVILMLTFFGENVRNLYVNFMNEFPN
jgi:Flp pilus assembly pilin Flp